MINVTCAIIYFNDKILVTQRSEKMKLPLKWEFPGGKLEEDESEIDCIKREIREEIREEINIEIEILKQNWEVLGSISTAYDRYNNRYFYTQAMVRKK